jgi:Domain of unknown function (DUF5060)/Protein of unknown function (DUF4038)
MIGQSMGCGMRLRLGWVLFTGFLTCVALGLPSTSQGAPENSSNGNFTVGQWGMYEIALHGPAGGNPFDDVSLSASFTSGSRTIDANGFYDGDGTYRIRFMPMTQGFWSYETHSNVPDLAGKTGHFSCGAPDPANHGPVGVANHFHFAYADGTPYFECGTTAYDWTSQPATRESQTLQTLRNSPFNKVRMCVFPSEYKADNIPARWPFEPADPKSDYTKFTTEKKQWNFSRINPAYFQNFERQVQSLADEGIEADVILFHPYAKTLGFATMPAEADDRYLHYVIARLAAYHNVWWSAANEYDHLHAKTTADWDRFFQIIVKDDPYGHLRSIQQDRIVYNKPWMTHASIQGTPGQSAAKDRQLYDMPIVFDEIKYEGDIPPAWGHLPAEDMVDRFWTATLLGVYEKWVDRRRGYAHREKPGATWLLPPDHAEQPAGWNRADRTERGSCRWGKSRRVLFRLLWTPSTAEELGPQVARQGADARHTIPCRCHRHLEHDDNAGESGFYNDQLNGQ